MQPICEDGGPRYLRSKPYYPWYGRGLVMITWEANYRKFNIFNPADALTWPVALRVLFDGMEKGMFTGKKLDDFFYTNNENFLSAREIINGNDRAALIAGYAKSYLHAIIYSNSP